MNRGCSDVAAPSAVSAKRVTDKENRDESRFAQLREHFQAENALRTRSDEGKRPKGPRGPRGGSCGACDRCGRILRRKHPDVRYFAPAGANGYLVEQVREIVADTALSPIQADKKIYILDRVDQLGASAANAFLKTLEEPADDVVMILLGRTRESVLPTIVSRCQVVPFRHIPASEAAGIVAQNTGADPAQARQAIEACGGSITSAVAFLRAPGSERLAFRTRLFSDLAMLQRADDWDVVEMARALVEASKAPLDEVRASQEEELAENADFLAKSAIRQIEARNKRQITAKTSQALHQVFSIASSWLRDVMATCAGTPEFIVNVDVKAQIEMAAARTDEARAGHQHRCARFAGRAVLRRRCGGHRRSLLQGGRVRACAGL